MGGQIDMKISKKTKETLEFIGVILIMSLLLGVTMLFLIMGAYVPL